MARLADIRRAAALTQVEVAERSGLSEQTILKLEAGLHTPNLDTLRALCEVLGDDVFKAEFGWKRQEGRQRGRPRKAREEALR
jgi:transcriptional regulator with XRE-family HTH domain